jgi:hypothetical protein
MLGSWRLASFGLLAVLMAEGTVGLVAQESLGESSSRLDVLLTTAPTLSDSARTSMMNEAAAIWRQHGVVIDWLPPAIVRPVAHHRLRVLIVQKRLLAEKTAEPIAVGELVRPPNGHPVAVISIEGARQMVASVRGRAGYELITVDERRLGIVLGRALAHEIGHYLLDTHTHARSGLMRPQFNALEFTDLRDGTFALDHDAAAWLRTRDVEKFAYAHR